MGIEKMLAQLKTFFSIRGHRAWLLPETADPPSENPYDGAHHSVDWSGMYRSRFLLPFGGYAQPGSSHFNRVMRAIAAELMSGKGTCSVTVIFDVWSKTEGADMDQRKQHVRDWMEGLRVVCVAEAAAREAGGDQFPTVVAVAAPSEADAALLSGAKDSVVPHVVDSDMLVTVWTTRQGTSSFVEFRHTTGRRDARVTRRVRVCAETAHRALGSETEGGGNAAAGTLSNNDFTQKPLGRMSKL